MFTLLFLHVQCIVNYTGYMYGSAIQTKVMRVLLKSYMFSIKFSLVEMV